MTQKHRLAYELLAQGHRTDEFGLLLTTDETSERLRTALLPDRIDQRRLAIVDCVTRHQGGTITDEAGTWYVPSPGDLTGLGMHTTRIIQSIQDDDIDQYRLAFDSVSTLLAYTDVETLFRFFHVMTARLTESDGLGIYVAHTESGADEELNQLLSLFDGVVETRRTDSDIELRVGGLTPTPTEWSPMQLPIETATDVMASTEGSP